MNVLIVDNYDSFTYNLYQFAGELLEDRSGEFKLDVFRNDEIDLAGVESGGYERIILSQRFLTEEDNLLFATRSCKKT